MQENGSFNYKDIPYGAEAQSLIAEPLLPEYAAVPEEPGSIREIAYNSILRMVLTERHKDRRIAAGENNYDAHAWTDNWSLSPEQHLDLRLRYADELSMISTHIAMANRVLDRKRQGFEHSGNAVRRRFQQAVREQLWHYVEFPGKNRWPIEDKELFSAIRGDSLAVVAPPGAGKTRLQAEFLQTIGIGEPLHAGSDKTRRALVVLPSQFMVDQYMGTIGGGEFKSILGKDASFGAIWEHSKATSADVTFVIASSVPKLLERGYLNFDDYCATIVDEGHFVLDGSLLERLQSAGTKMLFFTATPAKDELRDLRRYFHYVEEGSLREFIEGGVLNRSRLFSYFAHEGKEADMAAQLATQLVDMGRKVAVFCQRRAQGDEYAQTRHVVDYVNQHAQSGGKRNIARILGTEVGRAQNERTLHQYVAGDVRCIATVQMLGEGHDDPNLDAVILIGPFAEYEAIQKTGRCLRIGQNESLIIEILNTPRSYSLWQAFGFESIVHGAGIGFGEDDTFQLNGAPIRPGILSGITPIHFHAKGAKVGDGYVSLNGPVTLPPPVPKSHTPNKKMLPTTKLNSGNAGASPNAPDAALNKALAVSGDFGYAAGIEPVRTASFFYREREMAKKRFLDTATPICELSSQYHAPHFWLQYQLDAAEVLFEMDWSETSDLYVRHYARRAHDVAGSHAAIAQPTLPLFTRKEVLQIYSLHADYLAKVQQEGRVAAVDGRYSLEQLHELERTFNDCPITASDHISLRNVRREFRATEKQEFFVSHYLESHKGIPIAFMRSQDASGPGIPAPHIPIAVADAIHDAYGDVALATDDHISVTQIALLANASIPTVIKYVDKQFAAHKKILRAPGHRKRGTYVPLEHGHSIIEQLQAETLPLTHLPLISVMTRLAVTKKMPATYARNYPERTRKINIGPPYNEVVCLEWSLVRELEQRFPLKGGAEPLDFELLESNTDAAKAYARQVQQQFVDPTRLEPEDQSWVSMANVVQELRVTDAALGALLSIVDRNPRNYIDSEKNMMHLDLLQRARRHVTDAPPVGWYSHSQILDAFAQKGRQFPKTYIFERADRRLCRSAETGIMDIYYTPQAYRGVMHYSYMRTSEKRLSRHMLMAQDD